MTWFAGSRHDMHTPVIQRILHNSKTETQETKKEPILLFCRLPGGCYVFCGRVRVLFKDKTDTPVGYNIGRRPMKFVLGLEDYDQMASITSTITNEDEEDNFISILGADN